MPTKESFIKAISEVRKIEEEARVKRKFNQTVDLIINLREFDIKKSSINSLVNLPHSLGEKRVAGFLEKKSEFIDSITKPEFEDFKDKKKMKSLVNSYDFFIANAKLMPLVASTFGRALGPAGKMPSPVMGVVINEDENTIKTLIKRIGAVVKLRTKEPCIKVAIGKQSDKDENIAENAMAVFNEVFKNLPRQKENLKNILIKFTMTKPVKVVM